MTDGPWTAYASSPTPMQDGPWKAYASSSTTEPKATESEPLFSKFAKGALRLAKGAADINTNEYGADILRGAELTGTGIGEAIPFGVHEAAAAKSKELEKEIKHPSAKWIGETLPFLVGGEWLGAGKAASLVPEVAEGAEGVLAGMGRALSSMGKGAAGGAVIGGETGLSAPTGEQDVHEMARQKARMGLTGAAGGAVLGGAIGAGGGIAGEIPGAYDVARGKSLKAMMDRLTGKASTGAEAALSEESAKSAEALRKASEIETKLGAAKRDVANLDSELYTQRYQQADADAAADRVLKAIAAEPQMSAEKFGDIVRQESEAAAKKYRTIRENKSGLKDVFTAASKEPDIDTTSILRSIGDKEWNTTTGLERIKNELMTGDNKQQSITLEKAHSLKMELDDMWRTAKQRHVQFSEGKAAEEARIYNTLRNQLKDAAVAKYPKYGEGLEIFRSRSRPLDFLERKSPLAPLLRKDPLSGEYLKDPGDVVGSLLRRAKAGDKTLGRLIRENPALKDQAREFFRNDLIGNGDVTPAKAMMWFHNNRSALEQTGLLDEFASMKASLKGAEAESERAGTAMKRLSAETALKNNDVKAIQRSLDEAHTEGRIAGESADRYRTLLSDLEATKNLSPNEQTVDMSRKALKGIISQLNKDKKITDEEYRAAQTEINSLSAKKLSHHKMVTLFTRAALTTALIAGGWRVFHVGQLFTGI